MPDFMIIGAQKGGTTSLYYYLIQHPSIVTALQKEPHFFDTNYQKNVFWYRSHFPTYLHKYYLEYVARKVFLTGEGSPDYLFHPHAPKRIAAILPDVKLIVLLRNPVERAYSGYFHQVHMGREKLSFEDAIFSEEERTREGKEIVATCESYRSYNRDHFSYLARGIYVDQLQTWYSFFPREQILILKSEDLYTQPASIYKQTLDFLNVPILESKRLKKEGYGQYNKTLEKTSAMNPTLRKRLVEYYEPHNIRVESHKVVPVYFWQSLIKSCLSNAEHTPTVARQLTRRGELIDRLA
jgi:hypothetical protein